MIRVQALERARIDEWPLDQAGLPVRLRPGCRRKGYRRIGDIRGLGDREFLALRGVGLHTVRAWREYLEAADRLERGEMEYRNLPEVFGRFVPSPGLDVLVRCYGLLRRDAKISRRFYTLQEIGDEKGVTRERIRQMEEVAMERLRSCLVQACLDPVYVQFGDFLRARSRVALPEDVSEMDASGVCGEYSPPSVMLLLGDLRKNTWWHHRGYLTSLRPRQALSLEEQLVRHLREIGRPAGIGEMASRMNREPVCREAADPVRLLRVFLKWCPGVRISPDGLYHVR